MKILIAAGPGAVFTPDVLAHFALAPRDRGPQNRATRGLTSTVVERIALGLRGPPNMAAWPREMTASLPQSVLRTS